MGDDDPDRGLRFPQHRLEVYRVAVELAVETKHAVEGIPRGHRSLADQAQRAATSVVLLIAEGANRRSPADKRHRYTLARGECGELGAAIELAHAYGVVADDCASRIHSLAGRVNAMLLRLEQTFGAAHGSPDAGAGPTGRRATKDRAPGRRDPGTTHGTADELAGPETPPDRAV